ncbi:hypothetical protein ZWY2020_028191 [Hordeum vulgare]|uniref:Predicted protein n=1 Tax=Hordeum vulgare subsp. vulgare TaxID=112509 RepID=F2CTT5_HORVV|nr:hypothetical protein ZWY2020_028191 [Hordeum vulgare]BAJ86256.1 predicted protein [Hordeum vulgare subsp. vulgare]BAJ87448.1 predicted protein [Hordeum vulgare subsp. vulgare]
MEVDSGGSLSMLADCRIQSYPSPRIERSRRSGEVLDAERAKKKLHAAAARDVFASDLVNDKYKIELTTNNSSFSSLLHGTSASMISMEGPPTTAPSPAFSMEQQNIWSAWKFLFMWRDAGASC